VLPELIANYNARPSRALDGKAPADIGPEEEEAVRQVDFERVKSVGADVDKTGVGPGTRVRLLYSKTKAGGKDKFAKAQEHVWTSEIYSIIARVGPNSFRVDVPAGEISIWPLHALQVVKKSLGMPVKGPVIDKAVVRAQRLESKNISPEEVKTALEAPARPRGERAKRVDYKALAKGN
jgi:hypothetical protein